jgi:ketosteroid isomerase-like protein
MAKHHDVAVIRDRIEQWAGAIRAGDLDTVVSVYSPDIVSFDLDPPLRYSGPDDKRRAWKLFFAAYEGTVAYDAHELVVTTDGDLAFAHSLNHVRGKLSNGHQSDFWVRWTACFRKVAGVWMIEHDHVSVPADLKHGTAAVDLVP